MPIGLSLFLSILAVVGFFASVFGGIVLLVEARRQQSKPKMKLLPGEKSGSLAVQVTWNPKQFDVQIYRIRFNYITPENRSTEGQLTVTYDPPQTQPFYQSIELPPRFKEVIENGGVYKRGLLSVEVKTVDELAVCGDFRLPKVRTIYHEKSFKPAEKIAKLTSVAVDHPTVMTLDYSDLVSRKKKLKDLEAAAKAKAAKAAAAKPAAATAATAASPTTTTTT